MTATRTTNDPADEARIRALFETRTHALATGDAAAAAAPYGADVLLYDVVAFVRRGGDQAERLGAWLASYRTAVGHQIRDLEITVGTDLAFCHFLVRISGTRQDGTEVAMWVRATSCLRRDGDAWTIVHEHASVPFDPASGAAVLTGER